MDLSNFYLDRILAERHWSWAVIGIGYLILAIVIRFLVFRDLVREIKQMDRHLYSGAKELYLKNSIAGWVLFLISFLLMVAFWVGWENLREDRTLLILVSILLPLLFLLSVILHLNVFAKSLLVILRQKMGVGREF